MCFIDKTTVDELENQFSLQPVNQFNSNILQFSKLSNLFSDWIEQAREFERVGKYEEAIAVYLKAHAPLDDIYRCEINLSIQNRDFDRMVQYCILAEDIDWLQRYIDEPMSAEAKLLGTLYISLVKTRNVPTDYQSSFIKLIDWVYNSFCEEEKNKAKNIFQRAYLNALYSLVDSIGRIVGDMK